MDEGQNRTSEFLERVTAYRSTEEGQRRPPPPPPPPRQRSTVGQVIRQSLFGVVVILIGIQAIPYGRSHVNPPITMEARWDDEATWQLAVRACFDCHSNRTIWPWYSYVAPVSWVIQHDVDEGRGRMNFSEWNESQRAAREAGKDVREGRMPLWYYLLTHPEARLTPQEAQSLASGLDATIGRKR